MNKMTITPPYFIRAIYILLLTFFLSACSGGPPDDIVVEGIKRNDIMIASKMYKLTDWKTTNSYTRKIGDETIYMVEYSGTRKMDRNVAPINLQGGNPDEVQFTGKLSLVKRGNAWVNAN